MSKPIQVGDLVQVVRWECCGALVGHIYIVKSNFHSPYRAGRCKDCGKLTLVRNRKMFLLSNNRVAYENELKRIPPLEELEGERTEEKLKESE